MKYMLLWILFLGALALDNSGFPIEADKEFVYLESWNEGCLDIHHINTGAGDAAFFVFPDGTTMLFDAGDMDQKAFNKKWRPLKATLTHPSDSLNPGQWVSQYIKQVMPESRSPRIDYAVVSHFHGDHYGNVRDDSELSKNKAYRLTGITEVAENTPIGTLIDRASPNYDYPVLLNEFYKEDKTFLNYLDFVSHRLRNKLPVAGLKAGDKDQIQLKFHPEKYNSFEVRNVKSNGSIWSGEGEEAFAYFSKDMVLDERGKFNENPLSIALKITYGAFEYFTGGDMTGLQGEGLPTWFDVETPVAKAVGQVEATTLNHHGNRDATNKNFVETLDPRVVVQQSWCSDHPGQEVFHRLSQPRPNRSSRDIFATNIHEETKVTMGPWFTKAYKSMEGHILIRVMPGGEEYHVYILDDKKTSLKVKSKFGPYYSEDS